MDIPKSQSMTMQERKDLISSLAKKFQSDKDNYENSSFNESSTRQNFIDQFLIALGWDVANENGYDVECRDVKTESLVFVQGVAKRADYTLCISKTPHIIVEAKKPSVNIKSDKEPAIQARRYARSLKLPCAIVTNFKELAIYDARQKLSVSHDTAKTARLLYLDYTQYEENFEDLYSHISYQAVYGKGFDKWLGNKEGHKGYEPIDSEFLSMIEGWRKTIANDIALHNDIEDECDLTAPVQKLIDRIIFLRIAEGKGIEPLYTLKNCCDTQQTKKSIFSSLKTLFKKANEKYNSGLFAKDLVLEGFDIQDRTLEDVIKKDLYDECQYEFSVLPVEILGSVYEQFLGSVIQFQRKTKSGHSVKIEEKPEVHKAGGVFYTPSYIVDYIIEETIGKTIQGKTPKEAASLHFLDPACGSGSFLVGAYTYLLRWHLDFYTKKENLGTALQEEKIYKTQEEKSTMQGTQDIYRLSLKEKRKILCCNIFGVDIDRQAVEVTKLSLFLKLLEDESAKTGDLFRTSDAAQEKILPDLSGNIKCGNSLIEKAPLKTQGKSQDKTQKETGLFLDKEEKEQQEKEYAKYLEALNAFNWQKQFAGILATGGFDCVIGNPPYVSAPNMVALGMGEQRKLIAQDKRFSCLAQKWDLYIPFVELSLSLLKKKGLYSAIIPLPFTNQTYARVLRKKILQEWDLKSIADFSGVKVFQHATVTNCIPVIQKQKSPSQQVQIRKPAEKEASKIEDVFCKTYQDFMSDKKTLVWSLSQTQRQIDKYKDFHTLGDYCYISYGLRPNSDEITAKGKFKKQDLISEEKDNVPRREYIEAKDIARYQINRVRYLEYGTKRSPAQLVRPTFKEWFEIQKLFFNRLGSLVGTYSKDYFYLHNDSIIGAGLWKDLKGVENKSIASSVKKFSHLSRKEMEDLSCKIDLLYLLAVMNSKYVGVLLGEMRGTDYHIYPEHIRNIPIPPATQKEQEDLAFLAKELLSLHAMKQTEAVKRQIEDTEDLVNEKVNALYGVE